MDGKTSNTEILTADEAASLLKMSRGGFYNAIHKGGIPYFHLFGRKTLRFRRVDIERLLEPVRDKTEDGKEVDHAD